MLEKLYNLDALNIEKLILAYYKKLGLTIDEAIILLNIISNLKKCDGKIKESSLAKETGFDEDFISNTLAKFIELAIIEFKCEIKNGIGEGKYTISSLFTVLEQAMKDDNNKVDNSDIIIEFLENKLLRPLSASEMEKVLSWKDENVTLDDVKESCKKVESKGYNLTILRIEKGLYQFNQPQTKSKATQRIAEILRNK